MQPRGDGAAKNAVIPAVDGFQIFQGLVRPFLGAFHADGTFQVASRRGDEISYIVTIDVGQVLDHQPLRAVSQRIAR
ncbi:hypothetical protein D3C87_2074080 [compost metagenome]